MNVMGELCRTNLEDMLVLDLVQNKCPHCGKSHVYQHGNLATFGSVKMKEECEVCHTNFTKDPGFYWGSMYVSYALAMMEAVIAYVVCRLIGTEAFASLNLLIIVLTILVCSPFNYRMARLVWLYIFPCD